MVPDPAPTPRSTTNGPWAQRRLRLEEFLSSGVWAQELGSLPTFRRWGYKLARVAYLTARGFVRDRCNARAAALTYVTVLSIVPVLALAFSIAKGLNVYEKLRYEVVEGFLDETFGEDLTDAEGSSAAVDEEGDPRATEGAEGAGDGPGGDLSGSEVPGGAGPGGAGPTGQDALAADADPVTPAAAAPDTLAGGGDATTGEAGSDDQAGTVLRDAVDQLFEFVDRTDFRQLTIFGLLILFYTVIKLLSSIESTLNDIWGVHRSRSWVRKVSDYISILVIAPVVLLAGVTGTASLNQEWMPELINEALVKGGSMAMMCLGYALLFLFLPNTRVRLGSAVLGGVVAGVLTLGLQVLHVRFQIGVARYNAIYSTFAALPVFLVWLNLSWMVVLLGAEVAFAHQNEPNYIQLARARGFDQRLRERIAVRLQARVVRAFLSAERAPRTSELALALGVPESVLNEVVEAQADSGLLALVDDGDDRDVRLVPGRDPARTTVQDVLEALKGSGEAADYTATRPEDESVDDVLLAYRRERQQAHHNLDLATLARRWSSEGTTDPRADVPAPDPVPVSER